MIISTEYVVPAKVWLNFILSNRHSIYNSYLADHKKLKKMKVLVQFRRNYLNSTLNFNHLILLYLVILYFQN